jgi:glucosamine--fructose-6-phosphate aminotransferase (isomerizing)
MCGIVGYVGSEAAAPVLVEGLRLLEYRGYDSAGVLIVDQNSPSVSRAYRLRAEGRVANLERLVAASSPAGSTGIGHTRWATHGTPSERNAHPHSDCSGQVFVVHNGIVENAADLKLQLINAGHAIASDTDTEVIPHLIEDELRAPSNEGSLERRFLRAVRTAAKMLKGSQAIVIAWTELPGLLVAVRLGHASGISIGRDSTATYLASDIHAINSRADKFIHLMDGEVVVISGARVNCCTLQDDSLKDFSSDRLEARVLDPSSASKGGFPHFMLKEIYDQPQALENSVAGRLHATRDEISLTELETSKLSSDALASVDRVILTACGTPWHACLVGAMLIEKYARMPANAYYAHEMAHGSPYISDRTLVVCVTQSGETADVLLAQDAARRAGAKLLSIVNVPGAQATRRSDATLPMRCGPEFCVAETKAFTAQLSALSLLALHLRRCRGLPDNIETSALVRDLRRLPSLTTELLQYRGERHRAFSQRLAGANSLYFLGRGIQYPVALEGALKLKELSYAHAEGYPAGEMKHGPIALITDGYPVVAMAMQDEHYDRMVSQIRQAHARGAAVFALVSDGDSLIQKTATETLALPLAGSVASAILASISLQLLAYHVAVAKGCDVDHPRNLAKSVTVE